MKVIKLKEKFNQFTDQWSPKIIAELNGQEVKIAKLHGEFVWHDHADEDELFFVVQGTLKIEFRDKMVELKAGEMIVVPRGVEHKPIAEDEVWVMLFEPANIKHTGGVEHELRVETYEKI